MLSHNLKNNFKTKNSNLLLLYLRARYADLQNACRYEFVGQRLVVEVDETKTSGRISDRLGLFLTGPVQTLSGNKWFQMWMAPKCHDKDCMKGGNISETTRRSGSSIEDRDH